MGYGVTCHNGPVVISCLWCLWASNRLSLGIWLFTNFSWNSHLQVSSLLHGICLYFCSNPSPLELHQDGGHGRTNFFSYNKTRLTKYHKTNLWKKQDCYASSLKKGKRIVPKKHSPFSYQGILILLSCVSILSPSPPSFPFKYCSDLSSHFTGDLPHIYRLSCHSLPISFPNHFMVLHLTISTTPQFSQLLSLGITKLPFTL